MGNRMHPTKFVTNVLQTKETICIKVIQRYNNLTRGIEFMKFLCFGGKGARGTVATLNSERVEGKKPGVFKRSRSNGLVSTGEFYEEEFFKSLLGVERRKSERSRRPFLLMLISLDHMDAHEKEETAGLIASSLLSTTRETDLKGWYKSSSVMGVAFHGHNAEDISRSQDTIFDKVCGEIKNVVGLERYNRLEIELDVYPKSFVQMNSRHNAVGTRGA
jgi:hypothetical protein